MKVVTGNLEKLWLKLRRLTLKLGLSWVINSFVAFLVNGGVYTDTWPCVWQWLIQTNWNITGPWTLSRLLAQASLWADGAHAAFQAVVSAFHEVFCPHFLPRAPQFYGRNRYSNPRYSQLIPLSLSCGKLLPCLLNSEWCLGLRLGGIDQSRAANCSLPQCLLLLFSEINFMGFWLMQGLLPAGSQVTSNLVSSPAGFLPLPRKVPILVMKTLGMANLLSFAICQMISHTHCLKRRGLFQA